MHFLAGPDNFSFHSLGLQGNKSGNPVLAGSFHSWVPGDTGPSGKPRENNRSTTQNSLRALRRCRAATANPRPVAVRSASDSPRTESDQADCENPVCG